MKNLLFILFFLTIISCSSNDDDLEQKPFNNVHKECNLDEGFYYGESSGMSFKFRLVDNYFNLRVVTNGLGKLLVVDNIVNVNLEEINSKYCELQCYNIVSKDKNSFILRQFFESSNKEVFVKLNKDGNIKDK